MWRRVSCEQPLHKSQSTLSPRRNPMLMGSNRTWLDRGCAHLAAAVDCSRRAKGNPVPIPEPGCGTVTSRALACERSSG